MNSLLKILTVIFFLTAGLNVSADQVGAYGTRFTAPTINGISSVTNPLLGDIAYDVTTGNFLGFGSSSAWVQLSGASSQWTSTGTNVSYSSGSVGIGTTSPLAPLEVYGSSGGRVGYFLGPSTSVNVIDVGYGGATNQAVELGYQPSGNYGYLAVLGGTSTALTLNSNNNVGIGTANPVSNLNVAGGGLRVDNLTYPTSGAGVEINYVGGIGTFGTVNGGAGRTEMQTNVYGNPLNLFGNTGVAMTILDGGNVGVGTTSPSYTLHVVGTAGLSTGTAWTNASDIRLKDVRGDYEYGLNEILKLHTVRFNYKKNNPLGLPSDHPMTGFIAQEVQKVIPEAVQKNKNGYLELNVDPIHWAVVNAFRDLKQIVDSKDQKINQLEVENASIKAYLCGKDPGATICN